MPGHHGVTRRQSALNGKGRRRRGADIVGPHGHRHRHPSRAPAGDLVAHARAAEAVRFAEAWLWEDYFKGGGIAQAATALAVSERITVGLGIMPAPVRNAAFTAMEVALLARLHPGRLHPGLGHGVADSMARSARGPSR